MSADRSSRIAWWLTNREEYRDFEDFALRFLKVLNRPETSGHGKVGTFVPFVMNAVQRDLYDRIEKAKAEGRPARFVILKARRMGISTFIQAYQMHQCLTQRNRKAFVVALDRMTTTNIASMAKAMHANMPSLSVNTKEAEWRKRVKEDPHCDLRPQHRRSNDNELWFTHPSDETRGLNSRFQVVLADSADSTRGFECHLAHLSEVAFYADAAAFMLPMMQTVSDDPDTMVILESTANGAGGYFYDIFWRHWKGKGGPDLDKAGTEIDGDWESIFYPWHGMPDYRRALPDGMTSAELLQAIPDELTEMVEEFDLDAQQTYWAYRCWADKCQADWDLFKQEYPGKPDDAFAHAARRVFAEKDLAVIEQHADRMRPILVGDIIDRRRDDLDDRTRIASYSDMSPELIGEKSGPLWVWENPKSDRKYLIFGDPSSGSQTGDNTGIQVIDMETRRQVAEFARPISPIEMARKLCLLGLMYNDALVAWEINGVGHAVSHALMASGYWNLYVREQVESIGATNRFGWATNISTKPMMIAVGEDIVQRRLPVIRSTRLLREMRMFLEFAKKATSTGGLIAGDENYRRVRCGAPPGETDDLVMSWLGAQIVCDMELGFKAWEANSSDGLDPLHVPSDHIGSNKTIHWESARGTRGPDVEVYTGRRSTDNDSRPIGSNWF
jgi:hypothetical protein